jgi:hypothetical protein
MLRNWLTAPYLPVSGKHKTGHLSSIKMKRNLVDEISDVRSREELNSRLDYSTRLSEIENSFIDNLSINGDFDRELIKYIPIATVACFEAFFRSVYKELIDFGLPYSSNAIKFNQSKNVKFDFEVVNAVQNKKVTVGEFISHILPCNNFDDINTNISTLANIDFVDQIKKFKQPSIFEHVNEISNSFIENSDAIIYDIKRTFELRHIFCHEFATNLVVNKDEIIKCFYNSKVFLEHTNNFIWHLLYPNAPETQAEMNNEALKSFENSERLLTNLIQEIKESEKIFGIAEMNTSLFDRTIEKWKKYRNVKAEFDASFCEGGSMYPLIYSNSLTATTNEKIQSLKKEYEKSLMKNACR